MIKLEIIEDSLHINDGKSILSAWNTIAYGDKIFLLDAYGKVIIISEPPVETHNGIRDDISDIVSDIGFKGRTHYVIEYDKDIVVDYQSNNIKV